MHPNKKRKPKHTAKFRYDNLSCFMKAGASKFCKATSINPIPYHGYAIKFSRYERYSMIILQDIEYVYTARKPRKGNRRFS